MTDTEVLDWLEQNMEEYLVVPPHSDKSSPQYCPEWSIYKHGDQFVGRAFTLRECVEYAKRGGLKKEHWPDHEATNPRQMGEPNTPSVSQDSPPALEAKCAPK